MDLDLVRSTHEKDSSEVDVDNILPLLLAHLEQSGILEQ